MYVNIKLMLDYVNYSLYKWEVIGDFKMIGILMGMQPGFTKYNCFLCLWDSCKVTEHYKRKKWPLCENFNVGENNIKYDPLVDKNKVLMPPLHIKLGLCKQFVKALDFQSEAFLFIKQMFPELSEAKVKEGIFIGPQVRKLLHSEEFSNLLSGVQLAAWQSFKLVVENFLGNHKSDDFRDYISQMLSNFELMGCRMSLKVSIKIIFLNIISGNRRHI